jgi:hypothetical protein
MSLRVVFSNPLVLIVCGIWALEWALLGLALVLSLHKPAWHQAWRHFLFASPLGLVVLLVLQMLHITQTLMLGFLALDAPSPWLAWLYGGLAAWGVWSMLVLIWRMLRGPYTATGLAGSPRLYLGLAGLALLWGSPSLAALACVIAFACYWHVLRFTRLPAD